MHSNKILLFLFLLFPVVSLHAEVGQVGEWKHDQKKARAEVCPWDEPDFPNFRIGPRSDLLDEVGGQLQNEFKHRKVVNPRPDAEIAQAVVDNGKAAFEATIRNRLSFREFAEVVRRWNEKNGHSAKAPDNKEKFKEGIAKTFSSNYEGPLRDSRVQLLEKAIASERAQRAALLQKAEGADGKERSEILKQIETSLQTSETLKRRLASLGDGREKALGEFLKEFKGIVDPALKKEIKGITGQEPINLEEIMKNINNSKGRESLFDKGVPPSFPEEPLPVPPLLFNRAGVLQEFGAEKDEARSNNPGGGGGGPGDRDKKGN